MPKKMPIHETVEATIPVETVHRIQEAAKDDGELPKKIRTVVEAIHSEITRNKTYYPADALEKSTHTWLEPFEKPVIKNHDIHQEPTGRVVEATFKDSNLVPGMKTIELVLEITDPDAIQKVMDGRYKTLSIGGSSGSVRCSVCAKDIVKEGHCGHQKGRTYEGKQAYWIMNDLSFDEISWVNVPSDSNAQVVQRNAIDAKESVVTSEGGKIMEDKDILEQVDSLRKTEQDDLEIQEQEKEQDENPEGENPEPETPDAPEEKGEGEENEPKDEEPEPTAEEKLQAVTQENEDLKGEIEQLKEQLLTANTTIDALTEEKETLEEKVKSLEGELTVANEESASFRKQNVTLATYTHKTLAESAARMEMVLGKVEESAFDGRLEELAKESSSSLKTMIEGLSKEQPKRELHRIDNPLHESAEEDEEVFEESASGDKKSKTFTIEEFTESIKQAMNRNMIK